MDTIRDFRADCKAHATPGKAVAGRSSTSMAFTYAFKRNLYAKAITNMNGISMKTEFDTPCF
jgi:hypothetical protein